MSKTPDPTKATRKQPARWRSELAEAARSYYPPETGLHICGDDNGAAVTMASFPMTEMQARSAYARLSVEFADPDVTSDSDVVVDLCVGGDLIDGFHMRTQMVDRFRREVSEA